MPLLNDIFRKEFGQEEVNKKAISNRGWNLLNQKLVEHLSISDNCNTDDAYSHQAPFPPLNFEITEENGASVLDRIMREQARNEGAKQVALKQQEEGYSTKQNIKESKKMSSGLLAKNGVFALDNPSFVQGFYECLQCTKQETIDKDKKQQKIIHQNINKVTSMDMNLNMCSKNLIYPNVMLTYNKNTMRMMLQCTHWLVREGSIASN